MVVWRFTGILGRATGHLIGRTQPLANNEAARCSTLAGYPARSKRDPWIVPDNPGPRRPAVYERCVTAETVSELCEHGQLSEAVEALGLLVQTDCCISKSLFQSVLKKCVGKKDLVLGRRVHAFTVKKGHLLDTVLCNHILRMYASQGRLQEALDVFTVVPNPDAFMWSSMISAHVKHAQEKQAIQLYHRLRRSSMKPDGHVFVAALQACARAADLKSGQQVHADVLASGVKADLFVSSALVDMYAKCGSLEDAQRVFDGLPEKDVVTWSAMIAGYSQQGMGQEALHLYRAMQEGGAVTPNSVTFVCLLQACASVGTPALEQGKKLHAQIRERGLQADVFVASSLVDMYAKCGSLRYARGLFDGLWQKNVVTWSAMIAGYSQQGFGQEALSLYSAMQEEGLVAANSVTFVCLLQACASVGTLALERGKQLHAQIREQGHQSDVVVASSLINMYAKCGSLGDAQRVFDGLGKKHLVMWTSLIAAYSHQGQSQEALHLYSAMQQEGMAAPDSVTFVCLLQACASVGNPALGKGKQLHSEIREQRLLADGFVANSLVNMYAKCGSIEDAQGVFDGLGEKDVVTWNAMIAGYSQQGMGQEALDLYKAMQGEGIVAPDSVTFVCLLHACARLGIPALESGEQLHAQIRERGFQADVFVASSLVNVYAKCGSLRDARVVFDGLGQKDVVAWHAMIAGYAHQGMGQEALSLYSAMQEQGIVALDSVTYVPLLQACASVGNSALETGKQVHAQISQRGLETDAFLASSLVHMYAKCGSLENARGLFDGLTEKDVVTWNAMIGGYSQQGMGQEALGLYRTMQEGTTAPDAVTFVCVLQACANVAALDLGRQLHAQIQEHGLQADVIVANSLINMYGKCGSMVDAQRVFEELPEKDVPAWDALMSGYSRQGDTGAVFALFHRLREDDLQPTGASFLSILTACSHTGLVKEGRQHFETMSSRYGISPTVEHYTCMVDLLSRAGQLDDALAFVRTMPVAPDAAVWRALLGACQKWNNLEVGRHAFDEIVKLDEKDSAAYVLMSNIYTAAQMWEQAQEMQARRTGIGAWKQPGQSWWIDMDGLVQTFQVAGKEQVDTSRLGTALA